MAWNVSSGAIPQKLLPAGIPHICVCVPHFGNVSLEWVDTTYGPLRFIGNPSFAKSTKIARGILNLDTERNMIAKMALEDKTVTHLLWLDSVPAYTPIVVRNKITREINISPISDLATFASSALERVSLSNLQTLDRFHHWTDISYVLRHPFEGTLKRISTTSGVLDVSNNHSVYLTCGGGSEKGSFKTCVDAEKLKIGQILAMPLLRDGECIQADGKQQYYFGDRCLAWLEGFFTAEGTSPERPSFIGVTNTKIELVEKAKNILERYFNKDVSIIEDKCESGKIYHARLAHKRIARLFRKRFYTLDGRKKVPFQILNAPYTIQATFLEGYGAGDGHIDSSRGNWFRSFTTNSQVLAMGLAYLLQVKGSTYSVHVREDKPDIVQITINKGEHRKCRGEIKNITDLDYNGYLYDIETSNHKFVGGVGPFTLHNTDCIAEDPKNPDEAVGRLLACNVPVVSGLYRAKKLKGEYPYAMWMKNPSGPAYVGIASWTGNFIKVNAIGLGFCLMRREVFDKVPYPWFVWDKESPSEDFDFCQKLEKYGFEISVFTDVKLSHAGVLKVLCKDGAVHSLDV